MEIEDKLYAFIINNVNIINDKMIFKVSSKQIDNMTNNIKEDLPIGNYFARFDIDSSDSNELPKYVPLRKVIYLTGNPQITFWK